MAQSAIDYIKTLWNKITNSKENRQAAQDGIKELEDFLREREQAGGVPEKPVLPDAPVYGRMEYDAPSDEEIEKNAESGLSEYKNKAVGAIEKELDALKKQYENEKKTAEDALENKTNAVASAYESAAKSTDDDLVKRGIARSSIAANKKAALEGAKAKAQSDAQQSFADQIAQLDGEIGGLEAKRVKALDDFNVSYAAKLTESILALKKEREQKASEALKYNNSIAQKEYEQSVDKTMKESDLYGETLDQRKKENDLSGKDGASDSAGRAVYNKMAEVLRGMNPIDAREALSDNKMFRANLSDYYFYLLYDEFGR